jgi:NOL1/NOP2/fmu family ribosome biogenesis protein
MFRKDPGSIQEWSPDHVALCSARQKRIVQDVLPCLRENGHIIYSTCTYNDEENICNVEKFVEQHPLESVSIPFETRWNITPVEGKKAVGFQFFPYKTRGEGFFVSLLRKTSSEKEVIPYPKSAKNLVRTPKKDAISLQSFVKMTGSSCWIDKAHTYRAVPEALEQDMVLLAETLRVIHCGVALGTWQKNIFIPDHHLAMSLDVLPAFPSVELSHQEALLFLKRELYEVNSEHKGWHLATFRGNGLGFFKNLGHRINNYLPQELRIRMDIGSSFHK